MSQEYTKEEKLLHNDSRINGYKETPYKKKKKKKSSQSDHKHNYEKVIVRDWFWSIWHKRCKICGRMQMLLGEGNKDFTVRVSPAGLRFMTLQEIHEKFPDVDIYVRNFDTQEYELYKGE